MRRTRKLRSQSGTQIAELALMTPFLLLLLLAIVEGAAMFRTHQVLNNAAREGARLSSLSENRCAACVTDIQAAVVQYAADNGVAITAAQVAVNQWKPVVQPSGIAIPASEVTVTMAYPLPLLSGLPFGIPATMTLAGTAEFQNFN